MFVDKKEVIYENFISKHNNFLVEIFIQNYLTKFNVENKYHI